MKKSLYLKFLNNQCTEEELKEVVNWIGKDILSDKSKNWGVEQWKNFQASDDDVENNTLDNIFDKIQNRVDIEENREINRRTAFKSVYIWLSRAAAILLLPILIVLALNISKNRNLENQISQLSIDSIEIVAPVGSRTVIELSDGSKVHLNYGSKLKYPQAFQGASRTVQLCGEAYFEIASNPEMPFIVNAKQLDVKAVGTKFNVKAYPDDQEIETTLAEGKVIVEKIFNKGEKHTIGVMQPGQHLEYNPKTGSINSRNVNVDQYISWRNGVLIFEDTPINEITEILARKYNVDLILKEDVQEYYYTGTFMDEHLYQILDLMTIATPITYKAIERKKQADGTYSKQKIVLSKK